MFWCFVWAAVISILTIVQRDSTQSSLFIILQVHSTCFGCQPHPSSGVQKTVTTASGTGYIFCEGTSLQCGHATQSRLFIILQVHSTCFGCQQHPSSGVHKTITKPPALVIFSVKLAPSNVAMQHNVVYLLFCKFTLQRGQASLATLEGGSWTLPEAVVTVLCTPVDGCGWHPKHVEWTCRIINRLLCVATRWTIINIDQRFTEP